jgi:hypothetical protein
MKFVSSPEMMLLRKSQKDNLGKHLEGFQSDASMKGFQLLQGEPIDGVWETESMVDEAGRRQDSAYAYLRPVMRPGGVLSMPLQMDRPVLGSRLSCTNLYLEPRHCYAGSRGDERSHVGCDGVVIMAPLVPEFVI